MRFLPVPQSIQIHDLYQVLAATISNGYYLPALSVIRYVAHLSVGI